MVEFYNYHGGGLETNRKGEKKKEGRTQGEKGAQSMKEKRVRVYTEVRALKSPLSLS